MKNLIKTQSRIKATIYLLMVTLFAFSFQNCSKDDDFVKDPTNSETFREFDAAMQRLWSDHMQYTYLTVDAFFNNNAALDAQLTRLLKNQEDIGAAIVPYYGQAAGDQLAELLKEHINGAVPVLTAAQNGDQAALDAAVADWFANGDEIATFLATANPENWEYEHMKMHMDDHLNTTIAYSVNLLQQDYTQAAANYDIALTHMMHFAHQLAEGIAKQFPNKF